MSEGALEPPAPRLALSTTLRRALLLVAAAIAIYAGLAIYADVGSLVDHLASMETGMVALAFLLSLVNYGVRFLRWEYYLARIDVRLPTARSAEVFVSGFAFSVTPGKLGEVAKSFYVREVAAAAGGPPAPIAKTAPIIVTERLLDVAALLLLVCVGLAAYPRAWVPAATVAALLCALLAVLASRQLGGSVLGMLERWRWAARFVPKLREAHESSMRLLRPPVLLAGLLLTLVAWFAECVGLWAVCRGLSAPIGLTDATFIYAAATLFGAVTFLPGGIGATEGSLAALLVAVCGLVQSAAVAATLLIRCATLWLAVLLGFGALFLLHRRLAAPTVGLTRRAQP